MQLSLHRAADETAEIHFAGCRIFPQFYSCEHQQRGVTKKSASHLVYKLSRDVCVNRIIPRKSLQRVELKKRRNREIKISDRRRVSARQISLVRFYCDFPITSYIVYRGKNRNLFGVRLLKLLAARDLLTLSIADAWRGCVSVGNVSATFVSRP